MTRHGSPLFVVTNSGMGKLIFLLWPLGILVILFDFEPLRLVAVTIFVVYCTVSLLMAKWANRLLAAFILACLLLVLTVDDSWNLLVPIAADGLIFAAFLPAIHLLRGVAERDPTVLEFQRKLRAAPLQSQSAWMLVGSNILGSVLSVGSVALLEPMFADRSQPERRREDALAVVTGTALAMTWSPFFVSLAVISGFLPEVALWKASLMCLGLATMGLFLALALMRTPRPFATAWHSFLALRGFLPMIFSAGLGVILLRGLTSLSTLEAGCIVLPPLCLLLTGFNASSVSEAWAQFRGALRATGPRIERIGDEIAVIALAFTLGLLLRSSPWMAEFVTRSGLTDLPDAMVLFVISLGAIVGALLSIHPMVAISLLLAVFAGHHTGVSDLALMGAALVGWAGAGMLSFSGMVVMVTSSIGEIPRWRLVVGRNLLFAPLFAVMAALVLIVFDHLA